MPGPGAYQHAAASENHNGYILNARYKSGGCVTISRGGQRFDNSALRAAIKVPGPGNYMQRNEINKKGVYSLAKLKNSGAPIFTRANRDTNLDTSATRKSTIILIICLVTPGPGSYRVLSEFGF